MDIQQQIQSVIDRVKAVKAPETTTPEPTPEPAPEPTPPTRKTRATQAAAKPTTQAATEPTDWVARKALAVQALGLKPDVDIELPGTYRVVGIGFTFRDKATGQWAPMVREPEIDMSSFMKDIYYPLLRQFPTLRLDLARVVVEGTPLADLGFRGTVDAYVPATLPVRPTDGSKVRLKARLSKSGNLVAAVCG
jgi:hypothetical protein